MTIEVLQTEKDIYTFVQFLYESGYSLSHRDGDMRKIVLTQSDAINSLVFDLYTSGGTYYIGDSFCSNLIYLHAVFDTKKRSRFWTKISRNGFVSRAFYSFTSSSGRPVKVLFPYEDFV